MDSEIICSKCQTHFPSSPILYFCPNCGNKLKDKALSTSTGKQIGVYLISFFLPPFGLWPAIKYLKQPNSKAKIIGWVAIVLTIFSIVFSVWAAAGMVQFTNQIVGNQMKQYENMGY